MGRVGERGARPRGCSLNATSHSHIPEPSLRRAEPGRAVPSRAGPGRAVAASVGGER